MIRDIVLWPDPELFRCSEKVTKFDSNLRELVADMFETMKECGGVGLAAIQVGVPLSLFVMEVEGNKEVVCNPVFIHTDSSVEMIEGCLSFPGSFEQITRYNNVKIECQNQDGVQKIIEATGLRAQVIQHESEHLVGLTFAAHLSFIKKERLLNKIKKLRRMAKKEGRSIYQLID